VSDLIKRGLIYESRYRADNGHIFANAVFIGKDKDDTDRYAALRGIGTDYKGEASGSDKHYSFSVPVVREHEAVHIFESAIDLISYMSISKIKCGRLPDSHLLSLAGVYTPNKDAEKRKLPAAVERYLKDYDGIRAVCLHLDNDKAGRTASAVIGDLLKKQGLDVIDNPPMRGKDVNEHLIYIRKERHKSIGGMER
jgi:hypothetical protein